VVVVHKMDTQNLYLFVKGRLIAIPDDYLGVFHWVWRRDGDDAHTLRITRRGPQVSKHFPPGHRQC
jgi:hypothetical protein